MKEALVDVVYETSPTKQLPTNNDINHDKHAKLLDIYIYIYILYICMYARQTSRSDANDNTFI